MSIRFGRSGGGYSSSEVMQTEDDDWRKIEDVAERRRIQNRLAQRNYRRKLRAKLEELEKKSTKDPESSTRTDKSIVLKKGTTESSGTNDSTLNQDGTLIQSEESATQEYDLMLSFGGFLGDIDSSFDNAFGDSVSEITGNDQQGYIGEFAMNNFDSFFGTSNIDSLQPPEPQGADDLLGKATKGKDTYYTSNQNTPASAYSFQARSGVDQLSLGGNDLDNLPPLIPSDWATTPESSSSSSPCSSAVLSGPYQKAKLALLNAMSNIQFPPGFAELMPMSQQEREKFKQKYKIQQSFGPDIRQIALSQDTIFNSGIINGLILSLDTLSLADDDTLSPYDQNTPIPEHIPRDLIPTALQRSIPHHPYIDIIPFPGFRDKMLRFMELIDEDEICHLMYSEWGVWGALPWDKGSWEIGEKFAEKYWFLVDDDMRHSSNFWRAQRGLKPLKRYDKKFSVERGRVLGEEGEPEE